MLVTMLLPALLRRALLSVAGAAPHQAATATELLIPAAACCSATTTSTSRLLSHSFASTSSSSSSSTSAAAPGDGTGGASLASVSSPTRPALVDQLLAVGNMSRRQQLQTRMPAIIAQYQRTPGDLGSPEVQIALLTEQIRDKSVHVLANKKDHVSKHGLRAVLNRRRKLLSYLRRSNFPRYAFVIHSLGLKDVYAKQMRYDKYRVGSALGTPAEPLRRYAAAYRQAKLQAKATARAKARANK